MQIVVLPSRANTSRVAVGSLAFVVAGAWLIKLGLSGNANALIAVIGAASVVFFGLCAIYAVKRLVWRTPALVIDGRGILDNASALGVGFIAWADIQELREYRFMNQVFLGVVPRNLDRLLAKQPIWKRQALGLNRRLGALPVNIPQIMLPMPVADLIREIHRRFDYGEPDAERKART